MRGSYTRDPCPHRILEETGASFCTGFLASAALSSLRYLARWDAHTPSPSAALSRAHAAAVSAGSTLAIRAAVFSAADCLMAHARGKDDFLNTVSAGFAAGYITSAGGRRHALRNAVGGALILSSLELLGRAQARARERRAAAESPGKPEHADK